MMDRPGAVDEDMSDAVRGCVRLDVIAFGANFRCRKTDDIGHETRLEQTLLLQMETRCWLAGRLVDRRFEWDPTLLPDVLAQKGRIGPEGSGMGYALGHQPVRNDRGKRVTKDFAQALFRLIEGNDHDFSFVLKQQFQSRFYPCASSLIGDLLESHAVHIKLAGVVHRGEHDILPPIGQVALGLGRYLLAALFVGKPLQQWLGAALQRPDR